MRPIAVWNSARDAWETPQTEGLFCEHLDVYSETFPTSGMTASGAAYELPTWEPATDDSASSSLPKGARVFSTPDLMPEAPNSGTNSVRTMGLGNQVKELALLKTPTSQLAVNGGSQHPDKRKAGGHGPTLADEVEHLLPTPTTQGGANNGGPSQFNRNTPPLNTRVTLLPSPRASEGEKGGPNMRGSKGDMMLSSAVHRLTGETTSQQSDVGKQLWEDVPLPLLSQLGATTATD